MRCDSESLLLVGTVQRQLLGCPLSLAPGTARHNIDYMYVSHVFIMKDLYPVQGA